MVATFSYDSWGVPSEYNASGDITAIGAWTAATSGSPGDGLFFLFGGMLYDAAAGLYLTKTRAYNPRTGRFMQRDILDEKGKDGVYAGFPFGRDAIGSNLYAWCGNNPVSRTDQSGKSWTIYNRRGVRQYVPARRPIWAPSWNYYFYRYPIYSGGWSGGAGMASAAAKIVRKVEVQRKTKLLAPTLMEFNKWKMDNPLSVIRDSNSGYFHSGIQGGEYILGDVGIVANEKGSVAYPAIGLGGGAGWPPMSAYERYSTSELKTGVFYNCEANLGISISGGVGHPWEDHEEPYGLSTEKGFSSSASVSCTKTYVIPINLAHMSKAFEPAYMEMYWENPLSAPWVPWGGMV